MEISNQITGFYLLFWEHHTIEASTLSACMGTKLSRVFCSNLSEPPHCQEIGGACVWAGSLHLSFQMNGIQMDLNGIQVSNTWWNAQRWTIKSSYVTIYNHPKFKPASFGSPCRVIFHNKVNQPPNLWFKQATLWGKCTGNRSPWRIEWCWWHQLPILAWELDHGWNL